MLETSAPSGERHGCLPAEAGRCTERCDFHITSGVKPEPAHLKLILEQAGATVVERPPTARDADETIVVSTEGEKSAWERLAKLSHVTVLRVDHVLDCVLQQQLDITAGRLG